MSDQASRRRAAGENARPNAGRTAINDSTPIPPVSLSVALAGATVSVGAPNTCAVKLKPRQHIASGATWPRGTFNVYDNPRDHKLPYINVW